MSSKKLEKGKTYMNVCVVGLSGYDTPTNCLYGVGKSCFCNRFIKSNEDEYYKDHFSIFSTSDFVGSVLNNDHFLYWGTVDKKFDDNIISFRLIEQTEFIDDASYLPLSKGGQIFPYVKRATVTKLQSPGKIMYINRDQVALQSEFPEIQMDPLTNGKIQVDGFICIYDVSRNLAKKPNHSEIQEDVLSSLLINISKAKRPVVVVATKCDDTTEQLLYRAHQFVHSKKVVTPLVESSADNFVNIDLGLHILYQLADTKIRGYRTKLISYQDGLNQRNELISKLKEEYLGLIKFSSSTSRLLMSWREFEKLNKENLVFKNFVNLCGTQNASKIFVEQAKRVKQHYEDKKLNEYLIKLPEALDELLPTIQSIEANEWKWEICQQAIKNHIFFDKWFLVLPDKEVWNSSERLFSTGDSRIPFDVLQSERSRACFDRHIKKLRESAHKMLLKNKFRKLLESNESIRPGTSWADASLLIDNEDSYKSLDETERKILFETYLRDITLAAKLDFQELLFESATKFVKLSKDLRPSEVEMQNLYSYLKDDYRYKNLENLGNGRDILLFNHIALMQSPNRCLSGPEKCMDRLMQQVVEMTTRRTPYNPYENERDSEDEQINILILGKDQLGEELKCKIKSESSSYDCIEYIVDGEIYGLNIKVHDSNQSTEELCSYVSDHKPQGYLAIFSTEDSLTYIKSCLEMIQKHNNMSLIIMLANEGGLSDAEISNLRSSGQDLALRMDCVFLDYPYTVSLMDDKIHDSQVQDALRRIIDVINKRVQSPHTPIESVNVNADIRVLLCAMCGDEYPVELILGPMMQHHVSYSNPEMQDTVMLEAMLGGAKKIISVTLSSYHRAHSMKRISYHGFILIYSATRKASLETLRAFASTLPEVPIQALAVTGSFSLASVIFHEETSALLLNDCPQLSTKQNDQFSFHKQAGAFMNFFNHTYAKRHDTELALQGIKRRPNDPLPEVPSLNKIPDHNYDGIYISIDPKAVTPNNTPYEKETKYHDGSDSDVSLAKKSNHEISTYSDDSIDDEYHIPIEHDETGMYARVVKKKPILVQYDDDSSDDEDDYDDDDVKWTDNQAFEPNKKYDPPYASVPFLPKEYKSSLTDISKKCKTFDNFKSCNDSDYASIDQIKSQIFNNDLDSISNISSKSKESTGSIDNLNYPLIKTPWHDPTNKWETKTNVAAPLAKPDNDEPEDIKLRNALEKHPELMSTQQNPVPSTKPKFSYNKKNMSDGNLFASTHDHKNKSIFKSFIIKVTPNPSPTNSDEEKKHNHSTPAKPMKKPKNFKRKKHNIGHSNSEHTNPVIVVQDNDNVRDRSNTLPPDSPVTKHSNMMRTLDHQKNKNIKQKYNFVQENTHLTTSTDQVKTETQTLNRKKSKTAVKSSKSTIEGLDLHRNHDGLPTKPKKKRNSIRFLGPSKPKPKGPTPANLARDWETKQMLKSSTYFGKPLKDIIPPDSLCPIFFTSVLKYIESTGMQSEGLYRISGNKHDIEAVQTKFEQNINLNLQELGVSVHAVTGALKNFFKLLPEPLIPYEISSKIHEIMIIMDAAVRLEKLRELAIKIPQPNQEVFKRFMCHLKRVSLYTKFNKMDVRNLQIIIYPTLLRPVFESLQNMSQNMNMGLFIQTCIEQSDKIFDDDLHQKLNVNDNGTGNDNDSEGDSLNTEPSFSECVLSEPSVGKLMNPVAEENDYEVIELPIQNEKLSLQIELVPQYNEEKDNILNYSLHSKIVPLSKSNSVPNDQISKDTKNINRKSIETAID